MERPNQSVCNMAKEAGVYHWEIAEFLGIGEATLTRWLRKELPEKTKSIVMDAIRKIQSMHKEDNE